MSNNQVQYLKYKNRYLQLKGGVTSQELQDEIKKRGLNKAEKQLNPPVIGKSDNVCNMKLIEDTEKSKFKFPSDDDNKNVCTKEKPEKRINWIVNELDALETAIIKFIKEFECCYNDFLKFSKDKDFLDHFKILVDDLKKKLDMKKDTYILSIMNSVNCIKENKYDPIKYYVKNFQSIIHTCLDYWNLFGILYSTKFEKYAKTNLKRQIQDPLCNNPLLKKDLNHELNKKCCDNKPYQSFKSLNIQTHRILLILETIATKSCDNPMFQYILREDMAFIIKTADNVQSIYPEVKNI